MMDYDDFAEPSWWMVLLGAALVIVTAPAWLAIIAWEKISERRPS